MLLQYQPTRAEDKMICQSKTDDRMNFRIHLRHKLSFMMSLLSL